MISKADVRLIGRCTTDLPRGDSISSGQYTLSRIRSFKSDLGFDQSEYSQESLLFESVRGIEICNNCQMHRQNCSCANPDFESDVYQIDKGRLVEEWVESVRNGQDVFSKFQLEEKSGEPWKITAKTNRSELVEFYLFFAEGTLRNSNFDPYALSFPIGFVGSAYAIDNSYIYSWGEFLDDEFSATFRSDLSTLQEPITKPFYDYESDVVEDFKDEILMSMNEFLEVRDYEPSDEVENQIRAAGNIIDISDVDIVAKCDGRNSKLLICHCEHKFDRWHMHRYSDGDMLEVSELDVAEDLQTGVRSRASKFKSIKANMSTISNAAKVLLPVLAILSIGPAIDALSILGLPIQQNQDIVTVFEFILMSIVTMSILFIVIKPYWNYYRFNWSIEDTDLNDTENSKIPFRD